MSSPSPIYIAAAALLFSLRRCSLFLPIYAAAVSIRRFPLLPAQVLPLLFGKK
jgi:hypothetical protein